jgi:hypothetical protein
LFPVTEIHPPMNTPPNGIMKAAVVESIHRADGSAIGCSVIGRDTIFFITKSKIANSRLLDVEYRI